MFSAASVAQDRWLEFGDVGVLHLYGGSTLGSQMSSCRAFPLICSILSNGFRYQPCTVDPSVGFTAWLVHDPQTTSQLPTGDHWRQQRWLSSNLPLPHLLFHFSIEGRGYWIWTPDSWSRRCALTVSLILTVRSLPDGLHLPAPALCSLRVSLSSIWWLRHAGKLALRKQPSARTSRSWCINNPAFLLLERNSSVVMVYTIPRAPQQEKVPFALSGS